MFDKELQEHSWDGILTCVAFCFDEESLILKSQKNKCNLTWEISRDCNALIKNYHNLSFAFAKNKQTSINHKN